MVEARRKNSVLVVDDEPNIVEVVSLRALEVVDTVYPAHDGTEAIEIASTRHVDIAILDVKMPVMAGLDCLKALRAINPDIVAVFLTGYGDRDTIVEAMRLGAYDFLTKPISNETLQATILRCCEHADLLKQRRKVLEALLYEYTDFTAKSFDELNDAAKASVLRQVFSLMELKLSNRRAST